MTLSWALYQKQADQEQKYRELLGTPQVSDKPGIQYAMPLEVDGEVWRLWWHTDINKNIPIEGGWWSAHRNYEEVRLHLPYDAGFGRLKSAIRKAVKEGRKEPSFFS